MVLVMQMLQWESRMLLGTSCCNSTVAVCDSVLLASFLCEELHLKQ